ncbi:MAG: FtsX-like permease family protein [Clostridiales bacterium]|nr:FtsX-like permease family protein [Clostridiales bacterium]
MSGLDALRFALCSLRNNWFRSLLTVLGFATGIAAVLTVLALGEAGETRVEAEIAKLGVNKVWIRQSGRSVPLTSNDANRLYAATGAPACASAYTIVPLQHNGHSAAVQVVGFDEQMFDVHTLKLISGREILKREFQEGSLVCLIDGTLADAFRVEQAGSRIFVSNRRFVVAGVVETMAGQFGASGAGLLIMPLNTFLATYQSEISEIILSVQSGQNAGIVARQALEALPASGDYRADTLEKEIDAAREVVRIFVMVLMAVACVCVYTGGVGVMNVMLLTVRERRQEIGMIKAIGGMKQQICLLFLLEAAVIAMLGGLLGALLGVCMTKLFGSLIGIDGRVSELQILLLLVVSAIVGVGFGILPAAQAARLEPVEALRSE